MDQLNIISENTPLEGKDKHQYRTNKQEGWQIEYQEGVQKNIYLFGNHDKEFKPYTGQLPYNLNFKMANDQIVEFLGEPTKKQGGKYINIGVSYEHLGLEITFQSKFWDHVQVAIDQIILFKPENILICAICRKESDLRCSNCKLVYYCSQVCQRKHWKVHKKYCLNYVQLSFQ